MQPDYTCDLVLRGLSMVIGPEAELALQAVARPQYRQSEAGKPHPSSLTDIEKGPCSGCDSTASAPLEGYVNRSVGVLATFPATVGVTLGHRRA